MNRFATRAGVQGINRIGAAGMGYMGRLGAAPATLPTQAGDAKGWIMVVVTTPPNAAITWQQISGSNPSMMLLDQPPVGALQEISAGTGDNNRAFNFINQNETWKFYLLPMDSAGNTYAPTEMLSVQGAPGIYCSPNVPASVIASTKAANPGLTVFSATTANNTTPPPVAAPWYEAAGDVSIGGVNIPVILGGLGIAAVFFGPKLLGK